MRKHSMIASRGVTKDRFGQYITMNLSKRRFCDRAEPYEQQAFYEQARHGKTSSRKLWAKDNNNDEKT